jgi:2-hydroxychromene-2-carboxylate isomerase
MAGGENRLEVWRSPAPPSDAPELGFPRRGAPDQPLFLFDLGSPACWLVAERILSELPTLAEWMPVAFGAEAAPDWDALAVRAPQPLRVPPTWPPDTGLAMRCATYAAGIGKAVAFALAAFRQVYAGGRDASAVETMLIAGAACEVHPTALVRGAELRVTRSELEAASRAARAAGVDRLPAILHGERIFSGADALDGAAAVLGR